MLFWYIPNTNTTLIESSSVGIRLPGPLSWHHPSSALCHCGKGKDQTLPHFPRHPFSRLKSQWCQEGLLFTSYQLFQIGFVFPFSVNPLHLMLTLPPKALYHTISFQSSDSFLNIIFFLHWVYLTSGVFKGQLLSRWVRQWQHFTNPKGLATLQ